jgi:hypothetical protein
MDDTPGTIGTAGKLDDDRWHHCPFEPSTYCKKTQIDNQICHAFKRSPAGA